MRYQVENSKRNSVYLCVPMYYSLNIKPRANYVTTGKWIVEQLGINCGVVFIERSSPFYDHKPFLWLTFCQSQTVTSGFPRFSLVSLAEFPRRDSGQR